MAKRYEDLTFTDDFMFCKVLEQDPELCRQLLELILDKKVGKLVSVNRQRPIEITADGKGVRFDVYAEDNKNTIYDVEMQNANTDSIPKRSRYAQGMIDLSQLEKGNHYSELKQCYVIYICRFNLFKKIGRHKYTFLNLCREDPQIELGDGTEKIYICTEGNQNDVPEKLMSFLKYITSGYPNDTFTNILNNAVTEAKAHTKWRHEYMTLLEHYAIEREEGRKEGREEERQNTERERLRADAAEEKVKQLEAQLAVLQNKR